MHKEHPVRLQPSVPGKCMVCNDTCTSWHYRCALCCFDLHLKCVLASCEEASTTSTAQSLKTSTQPPSSAPPAFGACYGYGYRYGAFPPPPNFTYAYGVPLAPPYFSPYANGHGIPSSSFQNNFHYQHGNSGQGQGGGGKLVVFGALFT